MTDFNAKDVARLITGMGLDKDFISARMQEYGIPAHMQNSLLEYITSARPVGGFLTALLNNDLLGAYNRADEVNQRAIPNYMRFLVNCAPAGCFGRADATSQWREFLKESK